MVHSPKMSKKFVPICIVRSDGTAGAISTAPASNSTKRLDPPSLTSTEQKSLGVSSRG
jgi:hypothetical protein